MWDRISKRNHFMPDMKMLIFLNILSKIKYVIKFRLLVNFVGALK